MSCGWEGNRRSGVTLAMRHRLQWFIYLRAYGLRKGDEHPASLLIGYGTLYPYLLELAEVTISCFFSAGPCISVDTTYYSGVIADYGALYCVLECVF